MKNILVLTCLLLASLSLTAQDEDQQARLMVSAFDGLDKKATVYNLIVDHEGILWAATNLGAFIIDPGNNKSVLQYGMPVTDLVEDNQNRMWASSGHKVVLISTGQEFILPNDGQIMDIEYFNAEIWMATEKGLFALRPKTGRISRYHTNNSKLKSNKINFVHADRHGILWVGTQEGYIRIEGDKWELEDEDYAMIVTEENSEGQWIISEDDMFLLNQYNRLFPVGIDASLYAGQINDFTFDKEGKIYLASDILVRYNPYEEEIEDFSQDAGLISKKCLSIIKDKNENIWIGTESSGLYILRFSDIVSNVISVAAIVNKEISCYNNDDGSVSLVVNGGLSPYSYQWGDIEENTPQRDALKAGNYGVTVTDATGTNYATGITIEDPVAVSISELKVTQISGPGKKDGRIESMVSGGTGNYVYQWSNGAKSPIITDLSGDVYQVTVTDENGCSATAQANIAKVKLIPELTLDQISVGATLRLEQLFFDADSSVLKTENYPVLDEIYEFLASNPSISVEIGGHTNTIPPHEYCDKLSTARAQNVAYYLYQKGLSEKRIAYKGYGKRNPLTNDKSLAGRQKNQRVELKILSK